MRTQSIIVVLAIGLFVGCSSSLPPVPQKKQPVIKLPVVSEKRFQFVSSQQGVPVVVKSVKILCTWYDTNRIYGTPILGLYSKYSLKETNFVFRGLLSNFNVTILETNKDSAYYAVDYYSATLR